MPDDFDKLLSDALDAADVALDKGKYKNELRALLALSITDIKKSVPVASEADYSKLISVVELASAKNLAQAQLIPNITALGKTAVSIAKLIPSLAMLFV